MIIYHPRSICIGQEVITEVSRITFELILKGKDKVKRLSLLADLEDAGLKALHLESIIKAQRIIRYNKVADKEPCDWIFILLHICSRLRLLRQ